MKKLAIAIVAALSATGIWAASSSFAYQGVLINEAGTAPLTGTKTVELRLYNAATGGSPLWGRAYTVHLDATTGLFSVEVTDDDGSVLSNSPSGATLAKVLADNKNKPLYIGLTLSGTSGEILPRQKLLAVPYAIYSADVSSSSGDFIVKGALTAASATFTGALSAKTITVSGKTESSTMNTTGDLTVGGNMNVTGTISGFGTVPLGGIIMWSGSKDNLPSGFVLCNGQTSNGYTTPDLRDRFVVGAGSSYSVGSKGGADKVTLSTDEMPRHRHEYVGDDQLSGIDGSWTYAIRNTEKSYDAGSSLNTSYRSNVYGTSYAGNSQAHENRPPYYALCFIMRTK